MGACFGKSGANDSGRPATVIEGSPDHLFKLVFVGDVAVGKSSIILRYTTTDPFLGTPIATLGDDFKVKFIEKNKKRIKLQIWDTAGTERYRQITVSYYRAAAACVVVFDLAQKSTFEHVPNWIKDVKACVEQSDIKFLILGNKTDLGTERQVSTQEAQALADAHDALYFETSAKDNTNINEAMEKLAGELASV